MTCRSLFLCLLCVLAASTHAHATTPEQTELLRKIVSELDARHQNWPAATIQYRVSEYRSATVEKGRAERQKDRAPKANRPAPKAMQAENEFVMTMRGQNSRVETVNMSAPTTPLGKEPLPYLWIRDGQSYSDRISDRYSAGTSFSARPMTPWDANYEAPLLESMKEMLETLQKPDSPLSDFSVKEQKQGNDEVAMVLSLRFKNGTSMTAWLLPALGYSPRKVERLREDGSLYLLADNISYRELKGTAYPEKATLTLYSRAAAPGAKQEVLMRHELSVDSIDTDASKVRDSMFRLEVPKDKPLYDRDLGVSVRDPSDIQKRLDEIVAEPLRRSRTPWYSIAAAVVLLLGLGVLAVRWKKKRLAG